MSERAMLVTVGYGGATVWMEPEPDGSTSKIESYETDGWRRHMGPDSTVEFPANIPVVDCTVEGCDTALWAVKGPMFDQRLKPNEYAEFVSKGKPWEGQRLSGMATCGLDVYLAHAAEYGCAITYAGSGEPFPLPEIAITGQPDALNNLIALGVATDPVATFEAVMKDAIMKPREED